ncbi:uncharacterized protein K489DRAFT_376012 [Dissoconium aciculare CBS 342.82]|uniref:Uncharacterized protein n=1 Tax=Dissoconium aciculare CBS 342.82 TaxID=1314786 RepID=A0A6J3MLH9_9PEZI|nr:uncharacterized protein K489DRAFT_376012 [Dissoconium aciculare CBS 342.82]KAF1827847.1 hypothetical protein K489DRAFT_376012 [Dissoconium aciculare CBS 342.82]
MKFSLATVAIAAAVGSAIVASAAPIEVRAPYNNIRPIHDIEARDPYGNNIRPILTGDDALEAREAHPIGNNIRPVATGDGAVEARAPYGNIRPIHDNI